jgi:hypothetical protein
MEVKGTAFIARKSMLEREHGPERFEQVLKKVAATEPCFRSPILATTRLPVESFVKFNDAVVKELYDGDEHSYFRFGEASATWALSPSGPYKHLVQNKSVPEFAASAHNIYRNYFTEGDARSEIHGNKVTLQLVGIDTPHVYFEYAIMGYFKRGLELVSGRKVTMVCERGFSKRDADVLYHFTIG